MSESDLTPAFAPVAPLIEPDGEAGPAEGCDLPIVTYNDAGEIVIGHVSQAEHECPEFVDVQCPCALYGTPCRSYEVTVDARALTVSEGREVPLPAGHAPGVVAMEVIASAPGLRTVRVTGPANMDPVTAVTAAIDGSDGLNGEGPVCHDEDCTCGFSAAQYPALVRCVDPLCPLPPIELIEYEDSIAWARIHQLTGCTATSCEIVESGSGEISR